MTRARDLDGARRNLANQGMGVCVLAALLGLYGIGNAVAVASADSVTVQMGSGPSIPVMADMPSGIELVWPYRLAVPVRLAGAGGALLVKAADILTPLLWALVLCLVGLVCRAAARGTTIFGDALLRRVAQLRTVLVLLALLPTGLRLFGSRWVLGRISPTMHTATTYGPVWIPLFGALLCVVFELVLRHGARLQHELDEVI